MSDVPTAEELEQARAAGTADAQAEVTALELENAVLREAAGKVNDVDLTLAALRDRAGDMLDDDGHVDPAKVRDTVRQLLRDKPVLATNTGGPRPHQGASGNGHGSPAQQDAYNAAAARAGLRPGGS